MGKPADPAYWRAWRAAHPEYRERERHRHRQRTPEQRRAERERAKARAGADADRRTRHRQAVERHQAAHAEAVRQAARERMRQAYARQTPEQRERKLTYNAHRRAHARADRLMADARRITTWVVRPDVRSELHDPLYDDALSVAVEWLWYLRGRPPAEREARVQDEVRAFVRGERTHRVMAPHDVTVLHEVLAA